ncbi:MAG: hypothetical protein JNK82_30240 [Myxococcaceae bacterium]|nr:hypothetical protein [Myxococcaceae bacterium]
MTVETFVRELPGALDREHALLPVLRRLGVCDDELRVLEGDAHLLRILAEAHEADALEEVLSWHRARLARVAGLPLGR